jgi:hypothetical protein
MNKWMATKKNDFKNNPGSPAAQSGISHIKIMHRLGRLGAVGAILVMLGIPTVLGIYFHALPSFREILRSALPMLIIFGPNAFSNVISYTPILGSSIYLTLITGEVTNLKIPVVNNALSLTHAEPGTENADLISAIAVSIATFVTLFIVSICVVLIIPLSSVLSLPLVRTVSANILPALFGSLLIAALEREPLNGVRITGQFKGMILSTLIVLLIIIFDPAISRFLRLDKLLGIEEGQGVIMSAYQGFVMIALIPVTYFSTKWLYKKQYIRVYLPGETPDKTKERAKNGAPPFLR